MSRSLTAACISDSDGRFAIDLLPHCDCSARAEINGMSPEVTPLIHLDIGGVSEIQFRLSRWVSETVTVSGVPQMV